MTRTQRRIAFDAARRTAIVGVITLVTLGAVFFGLRYMFGFDANQYAALILVGLLAAHLVDVFTSARPKRGRA